MRIVAAVAFVVILVVAAIQTGSAAPPVRFVSPALATFSGQDLGCNVVNADDVDHTVKLQFFDFSGLVQSSLYSVLVPAHGSDGVSIPGFSGHCEITATGRLDVYRGSIVVTNGTTTIVALPMY